MCSHAHTHSQKITRTDTLVLIAAVWWVICRSCDEALAFSTKQIPQALSWDQRFDYCTILATQMHSNEDVQTQTQRSHNLLTNICCATSLKHAFNTLAFLNCFPRPDILCNTGAMETRGCQTLWNTKREGGTSPQLPTKFSCDVLHKRKWGRI